MTAIPTELKDASSPVPEEQIIPPPTKDKILKRVLNSLWNWGGLVWKQFLTMAGAFAVVWGIHELDKGLYFDPIITLKDHDIQSRDREISERDRLIANGKEELKTSQEANTKSQSELFTAKQELIGLKGQLALLRLASPLYERLPADTEFLGRGLVINLEKGATVQMNGPGKQDSMLVKISQVLPLKEKESEVTKNMIAFAVVGTIEGNQVNHDTKPYELKRETFIGPIDTWSHQIYLYVDEVDIGQAKISVARRKKPNVKNHHNFSMGTISAPSAIGRWSN